MGSGESKVKGLIEHFWFSPIFCFGGAWGTALPGSEGVLPGLADLFPHREMPTQHSFNEFDMEELARGTCDGPFIKNTQCGVP